LRKSQYFPFECSVLNKGATGTIFITSSVWRGPWLGDHYYVYLYVRCGYRQQSRCSIH